MRWFGLSVLVLFAQVGFAVNADSLVAATRSMNADAASTLLKESLSDASYEDSATFFNLQKRITSEAVDPKVRERLHVPLIIYEARWSWRNDRVAEAQLLLQKNWEALQDAPPELFARAALLQSDIYLSIGAPHNSIDYSLQALDAAQTADDSLLVLRAFNAVGEGYRHAEEHESALKYYDDGLAFSEKSPRFQPRLLNNSGIVLIQLERFDESKLRLERGLKIAMKNNDDHGIARLLTNLGFIHKEAELYESALAYYQRSLEAKRALNDQASIAYTLNDIGEVLSMTGNYEASLHYSREALALAEKAKQPYYIRDMNLTLAYTFRGMGKHDSAFHYYERYQAFQDSIVNIDNARDLARIERVHELKEKEQRNQLLEAQNALNAAKIDQQQSIMLLLVVLILTLMASGVLLFAINRKRKRLLHEVELQNKMLQEQNAKLTKTMNEQDSLFDIVAHDLKGPLRNIGELVSMQAEEVDPTESETLREHISQSAEGALEFIEDFELLQSLEKGGSPPSNTFDVGKLIESVITELSGRITNKKLDIHFSQSPLEVTSVESFVRHIVYNLLSNAIKFTPEGGNVFISVIQKDTTRISIEDDGPGIPKKIQRRVFERFYRGAVAGDEESTSSGLGLALVDILVTRLGGRIKLKSEEGRGTTFTVYLS